MTNLKELFHADLAQCIKAFVVYRVVHTLIRWKSHNLERPQESSHYFPIAKWRKYKNHIAVTLVMRLYSALK